MIEGLELIKKKAKKTIDIAKDLNAERDVDNNNRQGALIPILPKDLTIFESGKRMDSLSIYLKEIGRYDLLSIEEERALVTLFNETGDIEIAKKLVLANLRLVVKIAMEYRNIYQNVMDLIQEGNIGLMKGVSKYDLSKGTRISYYASFWIRSYILKFTLDNFHLVKIGTTNDQKKLFYNLLKEKNRLLSMGIEPHTKLIAQNLGVSEKATELMGDRLSEKTSDMSFDAPLSSGESSSSNTLFDLLPDRAPSVEEELERFESLKLLKDNLGDFVDQLTKRDREIFKDRLLAEMPLSLQELGNRYGVSRERIRQIEERLLKKLKVYMSEFFK